MGKFMLEYWEDEGWFVGRLPEVPGVFSQGESLKELKKNIADAYALLLECEPNDAFPNSRSRIEDLIL